MENYLMLNGKRIDLTEEQVKTLTAEEKKNPFARVDKHDKYSCIYYDGNVLSFNESETSTDEDLFSVANYCTDKAMMEQRALHEIINRLLWRYSEEHGGDTEWDEKNEHYTICKTKNGIGTDILYFAKHSGCIYFKDIETAKNAIDKIVKPFVAEHPEFVW